MVLLGSLSDWAPWVFVFGTVNESKEVKEIQCKASKISKVNINAYHARVP